ncbi:unnamed protein product [Prorocentrum cordatum]|uniref:Uncharacterized protein n=1 Tax=Prorocentrum cordatum TaxID=2364126 RepID=A0ABN9V3C0_9DINO|nr:unnamed protein product [Polarella glacialis]
MQASRQKTLQLGSPAKEISGKPKFQDSQRSPGIESVSTNTGGVGGGNPWSPGRSAYRLKRYSIGGATTMFREEDIPQEDDPLAAIYGQQAIDSRTNPKTWTHSEKLRNWEKRLHGDAKLAEKDEQLRHHREQQQAHDASLTEAFGQSVGASPGSPRARSCEASNGRGIAGHPSQIGMRAAFTDRALKLAHMSEHFSLAHTADASMETQSQRASVASGSPASFDMPAAGNGSLTKAPKSALATMHMHSADAGSPLTTARAASNPHSDRMGYLLQQAAESERDQDQVKEDEDLFRHQMGNRHPGDMAPTTRAITKARARSAESFAGASRPWGSKLDVFKNAAPGEEGERHSTRRHVQDWLPSDRVTMAQCLTSARDDAAAEPVDIVFMQGHSPPCTKFSSTADQKKQGSPKKQGWKDGPSGRPDYWFDRTGAYGTGRRRGRGECFEHSAESTKQSIARDAESAAMYRYELMATGEATPRACSQPPVYNPFRRR